MPSSLTSEQSTLIALQNSLWETPLNSPSPNSMSGPHSTFSSQYSPCSAYNNSEVVNHPPYKSSFFPISNDRRSSFANDFLNNGGAVGSLSSVSSDNSSISTSSSYSPGFCRESFSSGNVTLPLSNRLDDYAQGAALFNQGSTSSSIHSVTTISSPSPGVTFPAYRRASAIELEYGQPLHQPLSGNFPCTSSSSSRLSPLTGSNTFNLNRATKDGQVSGGVLDRFSELAQATQDAELIANGMKNMELNADAVPFRNPHVRSNPPSRQCSVSSNFFPSPSGTSDSFNSLSTPPYGRSNSINLSSIWQQSPLMSGLAGSTSCVSSPANSSTVLTTPGISTGSTDIFPNNSCSDFMPSANGQYYDDSNVSLPVARSPLNQPYYPSVFSSPTNSVSGLSDAWGPPAPLLEDSEYGYRSPSPMYQNPGFHSPLARGGTPPTCSPSRLPNSGINADRNLRQQLAHQHQQQFNIQPQVQSQHYPKIQSPQAHVPLTFRFNSSQPFHPQAGYPLDGSFQGNIENKTEFHNSRSSSSSGFSNRKQNGEYSSTLRSPLLEEFRNSKNKNYELQDIFGHVVEFSGDQYGSRFIQQRLESASSEDKQIIFNELRSNSLQLMTDVFGNYVIQKFFELGNQMQKTILANQMEGHVLVLSLQMYGCRVVQKAIEHILTYQQASLIKELDGNVLQCVKDQNGNHVIQKAIERIPPKHIKFIIEAFYSEVYNLATHPYGCRVIQRILQYCDEDSQSLILKELHGYTFLLVEDQYGNYVVQHLIERGKPSDRQQVMDIVKSSILSFSRHKFASNVVEKCIIHGSSVQRDELIEEILKSRTDGVVPINIMMKDQFANYVIQKLLEVNKGKQHDKLVDAIKPQLDQLKKFSHGKHLVSIEKLINQSGRSERQN